MSILVEWIGRQILLLRGFWSEARRVQAKRVFTSLPSSLDQISRGMSRFTSELRDATRPRSGLPGRAEHFIAYAGTGVFVALGYVGRRQRVGGWLGLAAASELFEFLQNFIPGRSPSLFDARRAAEFLGADRGAGFWRSLRFWHGREND